MKKKPASKKMTLVEIEKEKEIKRTLGNDSVTAFFHPIPEIRNDEIHVLCSYEFYSKLGNEFSFGRQEMGVRRECCVRMVQRIIRL